LGDAAEAAAIEADLAAGRGADLAIILYTSAPPGGRRA
jgi:hypothetical protein